MKTLEAKNISISINANTKKTYEFTANPENLPLWASGLSNGIKKVNGEWVSESPMGKIKIKMADKNEFGVLDHYVILESGQVFYNPMRAFDNKDGCEVLFTLYRQPEATDDQLKEDQEMIKKDLLKLKSILEKN